VTGAPARRPALSTSLRVDRGRTASEPRNLLTVRFLSWQGRPEGPILAPTEVTRMVRDHGLRIVRTNGDRFPGISPST
jgi:hypothetical protein